MSGERPLPAQGDKITVLWPRGPHNFEMEFIGLDMDHHPHNGYEWLRGIVGYDEFKGPRGEIERWPRVQTLYARYVEPGVWTMVPKPD